MDDQKKEFTGVFIPRVIIEDQELSMTEKYIYAEIACFRVCYKSNESLGEHANLSSRTVSRAISVLIKKGYVFSTPVQEGRFRELRTKFEADVLAPTTNLSRGVDKNGVAPQTILSTIDNNIDNNKNHTETPELEDILEHWNTLYETQYRSVIGLLPNYKAARKSYSVEEIKTAINNIKDHDFWKDKMTPTILFRKKNPQGEPVDYVGNLLSHKKRTAYTYMN